MKHALLLVAHGSQREEANRDLRELAVQIHAAGPYEIVEPAYLEIAKPDIESGCRRCVEQGAEWVVLLPYFLSAGVHVERDLEAARQTLAAQFPGVTIVLAEPIGRDPRIIDIVLERAAQAVERGA